MGLFSPHSSVSVALVWDSNPNVLKDPVPYAPVLVKYHLPHQCRASSQCHVGVNEVFFSHSADSQASLVLAQDSNPDVFLKDPTLHTLFMGSVSLSC